MNQKVDRGSFFSVSSPPLRLLPYLLSPSGNLTKTTKLRVRKVGRKKNKMEKIQIRLF